MPQNKMSLDSLKWCPRFSISTSESSCKSCFSCRNPEIAIKNRYASDYQDFLNLSTYILHSLRFIGMTNKHGEFCRFRKRTEDYKTILACNGQPKDCPVFFCSRNNSESQCEKCNSF